MPRLFFRPLSEHMKRRYNFFTQRPGARNQTALRDPVPERTSVSRCRRRSNFYCVQKLPVNLNALLPDREPVKILAKCLAPQFRTNT